MPRREHRPSVLLSREENDMVFSMIGPKCQSLATAVVQLFTTEGPAHSEWKKRDTGVLCLIKDNLKRSYFFRIYCLYKVLVWEHEVYLEIEYKSPRPFLHTFEAEEYMTAFNFANEDEAKLLRAILIEKIELRIVRREEKRKLTAQAQRVNNVRQNGAPPVAPPANPAPTPALYQPPKATPMTAGSTYTLKGTKKQKGRSKITKADIGLPQGFKHIWHVGLDQDQAPSTAPPSVPPPPPPDVAPPPPPPAPPAALPPPSAPPAAPPRPPAPPAAPPRLAPPAAPPRPAPPAAPPCPAPPAIPPPPPAPPMMPSDATVEPDARAALMESIRSGNESLKRVEATQGSRPPVEDSRSNLLSEIRQGTKLKVVSRSTSSSGSSGRAAEPGSGLEHGLAGLLKRALDERNRAIHSDSDEDEDEEQTDSNDDDWD